MPLRRATLPTVDAVVIVILAISSVLSIVCWVVLWRGTDHVVSKVLWTFIAAMPALGPLFFACLHNPPPVQPDVDRAPNAGMCCPRMRRTTTCQTITSSQAWTTARRGGCLARER